MYEESEGHGQELVQLMYSAALDKLYGHSSAKSEFCFNEHPTSSAAVVRDGSGPSLHQESVTVPEIADGHEMELKQLDHLWGTVHQRELEELVSANADAEERQDLTDGILLATSSSTGLFLCDFTGVHDCCCFDDDNLILHNNLPTKSLAGGQPTFMQRGTTTEARAPTGEKLSVTTMSQRVGAVFTLYCLYQSHQHDGSRAPINLSVDLLETMATVIIPELKQFRAMDALKTLQVMSFHCLSFEGVRFEFLPEISL